MSGEALSVPEEQLAATGGCNVHTVHFPAATPPAEADVLVVGADPVGLSAAIELSARGVGVAARAESAVTQAASGAAAPGFAALVGPHAR
jgi:ribulose 1,5-bisphosphate synthetase/thiazole synthase